MMSPQAAPAGRMMAGVDGALAAGQSGGVSDSARTFPSAPLLRWLSAYAGFPAQRLPSSAETLLCLADAAGNDSAHIAGSTAQFGLQRRDGGTDSAMRAHALRRSRVHFKCDNSAKV